MITRRFFQQDVLTCASDLVGCELVWQSCRGIIVETEAYAEHGDPACHTATRQTTRAFIQNHPPGTAYVYFNYGMHWMLNVLTKSPVHGNGLILIRAIQPTGGVAEMRHRRTNNRRTPPPSHDRWLCSGPGKLAAALAITGHDHGRNLCQDPATCLFPRTIPNPTILSTTRIGISRATELPWRFTLANSAYLSR